MRAHFRDAPCILKIKIVAVDSLPFLVKRDFVIAKVPLAMYGIYSNVMYRSVDFLTDPIK